MVAYSSGGHFVSPMQDLVCMILPIPKPPLSSSSYLVSQTVLNLCSIPRASCSSESSCRCNLQSLKPNMKGDRTTIAHDQCSQFAEWEGWAAAQSELPVRHTAEFWNGSSVPACLWSLSLLCSSQNHICFNHCAHGAFFKMCYFKRVLLSTSLQEKSFHIANNFSLYNLSERAGVFQNGILLCAIHWFKRSVLCFTLSLESAISFTGYDSQPFPYFQVFIASLKLLGLLLLRHAWIPTK